MARRQLRGLEAGALELGRREAREAELRCGEANDLGANDRLGL